MADALLPAEAGSRGLRKRSAEIGALLFCTGTQSPVVPRLRSIIGRPGRDAVQGSLQRRAVDLARTTGAVHDAEH